MYNLSIIVTWRNYTASNSKSCEINTILQYNLRQMPFGPYLHNVDSGHSYNENAPDYSSAAKARITGLIHWLAFLSSVTVGYQNLLIYRENFSPLTLSPFWQEVRVKKNSFMAV